MPLEPLQPKKTHLEKFFGQNQINDLDTRYYLYGVSAAFFLVFPMSVFRLFTGDYIIGMMDLAISLFLLFVSVNIWNRKEIKNLNCIVFGICSFFMLALVALKGINSFLWIFAVIAVGYSTVNKQVALICGVLISILATVIVLDQVTLDFLISYYPALIILNVLLYLGASKAETQQNLLFELATIDSLTRIKNRLAFNEKITELSAGMSRNKQDISLMILDIDHFKKINDTFGHTEGDEVLAIFANLIKTSIRGSDSVYRYGGEEFVVMAYNSNLESAAKLAESIRKKVAVFPCLAKYNLTVSIGVTEISNEKNNAVSWLDRADEALYLAKNRGRNKVYLALKDQSGTDSYIEYSKFFNIDEEVNAFSKKVVRLNTYKHIEG